MSNDGTLRKFAAAIGALGALGAHGLVTAGCTSVPDDAGFSDVARLTKEREEMTVRWRKGAADAETDRAVRELLARELDVDAAVQIALLRQPRLQALYEELEISRAALLQATLPPNPQVELAVRFGVTGPGFELGSSIAADVARLLFIPLQARLAGVQLEIAKLAVADAVLADVAAVKEAFARHVAAREVLGKHMTYAIAAEAAADLAARQQRAGTDNELFVATQLSESLQARLLVAQAELRVVETREELLREMGLYGEETAIRVPAQVPPLPVADVAVDDLEARAVAARLDLAATELEIEAASQQLDLAQPWIAPFFEGGVELEGEDGEYTFGPRVGFALPLLDWGQARRDGIGAQRRAAERRFEAQAIDVRSRVREAAARMITARARADFIRRSLLPARRAQVEQSVLHYNRMFIGVYDLLRARQAELEAERDDVEAREAYWAARAELERAVGGRLPSAVAVPPGTAPGAKPAPGTLPAAPPAPQTDTSTPAAESHEGHN